jgi:hypothetical protein
MRGSNACAITITCLTVIRVHRHNHFNQQHNKVEVSDDPKSSEELKRVPNGQVCTEKRHNAPFAPFPLPRYNNDYHNMGNIHRLDQTP